MVVYSRKSLEQLSRADLQKLCKDYGVKANLKSDAIIDLILDASTRKPSSTIRRSVSSRLPSTRQRGSSLIVHDAPPDDEEDPAANEPQESIQQVDKSTREPSPPATRTRKAKDTQTRLGVGRPKVAGGTGARAVTKGITASKTKRNKSSRSTKMPVEATIAEEPEPEQEESQEHSLTMTSPDKIANVATKQTPLSTLAEIDKHVAEALRPLHEQMQTLRSQVEHIQALKTELQDLKTKVARVDTLEQTVTTLKTEVEGLRADSASMSTLNAEISQLKETIAAQNYQRGQSIVLPTTPHFTSTPFARHTAGKAGDVERFDIEDTFSDDRYTHVQTVAPHPGFAPSTLGKRGREPSDSDMSGLYELTEGELARKVVRSPKKRARTSTEAAAETESVPDDDDDDDNAPPASRPPPRAGFTVFTGPEEPDDPPPTSHLPNFYGPPSPIGGRRPHPASSSQAYENEHNQPYNFSFVPPTPGGMLFPGNFPFLEPPQSPTPQHAPLPNSTDVDKGRTDVFQAFGLPAPGRSKSRVPSAASGSGLYVNPAVLTKPSDGKSSGESLEATAQPMKRTMYGTELEGDTRFGDFGTEGVATGFWVGGGRL